MMHYKMRLLPMSIVLMSLILGAKAVDFSFDLAGLGLADAFGETAPESTPEKPEKSEEPEAAFPDSGQGVSNSGALPTRKEIEYLQKLSERRRALDRRARALDDREKLLEAVELRIVERTESLKKIEEAIQASLKKHDAREQAQLNSLVKIYTAMKPKDAAQIFNNLDGDILIALAENMKEKNMGAILAKMNIDKAKKLTTSLATRKKLPNIEG